MSDHWLYFDLASEAFEEALNAESPTEQARLIDEVMRLHRLAMADEEQAGPRLRSAGGA
jgi:hypothetical protein